VDALKASDHTVTKLLKLQPYEVKAIQELFAPDWDSRSQWYRCFQELVVNGFHGLELVSLLLDVVYFTLTIWPWNWTFKE